MWCLMLFRVGLSILFFFHTTLALPDECSSISPVRSCLLRTNYIDIRLWRYYAGYFCYIYTNEARLDIKYNSTSYNITCGGENATIPVARVEENIIASYDYTDKEDVQHIRKSFKTDEVFKNYISCCQGAIRCCNDHMDEENVIPIESEKHCIWNGTNQKAQWIQQTDYTTCAIAPVYERRYNFHIIFLGVCIGFCIPAISIFFFFEKLRKTIRVILHRNLLIAIVVRNVLTIMCKELVLLDALKAPALSHRTMDNNGVPCRILAFMETSAINSIYACMFLDAYYLHKVIVRAFAKETRMIHIYIVLAALTFTFSIVWAIIMGVKDAPHCWMVDLDGLQWTVDGFRIAVLVINGIMLADIIRVMILKLRHGSTTKQTMAAFRATIFLIPLFGLHIIVTAKKIVYDNSCTAEDIYDFFRYAMEGLQGIIVSILFCYANNEVRGEMKNGYRKACIYLNQRFGWNLGGDLLYDKRRATTATFVQEGNF
ncbi:calcitonin gene-related peptide type 1 receptor isoform X2 [Diabrotica virgifera virgifera]|uniref:Calcitonin gene-related peptide type 1 receptor-like isoform X2 n=1 Tax=Diabrotica virgifera virgifera TaxID=50390 RepID=A0A6P7F9D4_DIAVI|nr:calcitonin gene-related peptide type 1 receptor isoform X2 [Diabrotica virgifera virgifera]